MNNTRIGQYLKHSVAGETYHSYIPPHLPPTPALDLELCWELMEKANQALGRLDGLASLLPDISLFLYFYVRKEAVLSSQIEGTQSSISDLLMYENKEVPGVPLNEVQEVSSYVEAITYGLEQIKTGKLPLCLRLLRDMHKILLSEGRGAEKSPGEFRRSQNWIGGTRPGNAMFVPPSPEHLDTLLGNLEDFLHDKQGSCPTLIKAAISHVQFETIHPFLDGNGRLGRLLITLVFCSEEVLSEPLLYLSLYFKQHRQEYYRLLQKVRDEGDWESWLVFFLTGVLQTATQAVQSAQRILALFESDRRKLLNVQKAQTVSLLAVHDVIKTSPLLSISKASEKSKLSYPTASQAFSVMEQLKIVREITGQKRGRIYVYDQYLKILEEGTELLADEP